MKSERPIAVVFFETEAGNEPVRQWLQDLPKEDRKTPKTELDLAKKRKKQYLQSNE